MNLRVNQKIGVTAYPKDRFGNHSPTDGAPVWSVSNEELASLEVAADGFSAIITPKGLLGEVTVRVSLDGQMNAGVREVVGELLVNIISGEAEVVDFAFTEPYLF